MRLFVSVFLFSSLLAAGAAAQTSSSSSSAPSGTQGSSSQPVQQTGGRRVDAAGSSITLETSEPLFDVAVALNACGYDADISDSNPVRAAIRADVAAAVDQFPAGQGAQAAVCRYMAEHELNDKGRELAQYVSLALFLGPAPALKPIVEETEMPPDALSVVNMLPLLRSFVEATKLHTIWVKHHAEYEAITDKAHNPVADMVLNTNIYLKQPISSYDGRRLLILVEPMLAPNAPNGRIYGTDYALVTSPDVSGAIRMAQIRHLYLQYEIEPLVYARSQSMERLQPLLKPVANAPLDYEYKTSVVALVTECLIRAIEARTMDVGFAAPVKPSGTRARAELARYDEEQTSYDRRAEVIRRKQVDLSMREGWVLTDYFYQQMLVLERGPESLKENMGQMVYGMDVGRVKQQAERIQFLPQGSGEFVRRVAPTPTGLALAEKKMLEGDLAGADELAEAALKDPKQDHTEALYLQARVALLEGDPETSSAEFHEVLKASNNPRTTSWAHVYLGRLYDIRTPPERDKAVAEYKAALHVEGALPGARDAATAGLKTPFTVPTTVHREEQPLDPSGKAEKAAYKPE